MWKSATGPVMDGKFTSCLVNLSVITVENWNIDQKIASTVQECKKLFLPEVGHLAGIYKTQNKE